MGFSMLRRGCTAGTRALVCVATGDVQIASQGCCGILGGREVPVWISFLAIRVSAKESWLSLLTNFKMASEVSAIGVAKSVKGQSPGDRTDAAPSMERE